MCFDKPNTTAIMYALLREDFWELFLWRVYIIVLLNEVF